MGSDHDSMTGSEGFASGSMLRGMISRGENTSDLMPQRAEEYCNVSKLDSIFRYRVSTAGYDEILALPDAYTSAADRIIKAARSSYPCIEAFLDACKAKNFTAAKLRRLVLHLVLGITVNDIVPLPYLRILAFNKRGTEILKSSVPLLPCGTSLAELEKSSLNAARIAAIEKRASILRSLGTSSGIAENEYSRMIRIIESE